MTENERKEVNKQIAMPEYLMAPDGRKFIIGSWQPSVSHLGVIVGVSITPAEAETRQ